MPDAGCGLATGARSEQCAATRCSISGLNSSGVMWTIGPMSGQIWRISAPSTGGKSGAASVATIYVGTFMSTLIGYIFEA